ncbi:class I adenylate-forming enzyme family protein [Pleionea sediminis]|uniref:class I adenylate-forming enzyme family protein n=1 Tax=Pleionea sediminis TaxID=2569479 RepID=UPI0013DE2204|nr:class I adenylate-forming enzyme family protein [Pleionea sediminis]
MRIFSLSELYSKVVDDQYKGQIIPDDNSRELSKQGLIEASRDIDEYEKGFNYGEKVVLLVDNSIDSVSMILACWNAGLVVVPVKSDMAMDSVQVIADDSNAKAIWKEGNWISNGGFKPELSQFELRQPHRVTGSDLALIIYTSGSTGIPKGIMLTHNNVITSLNSISHYLRLDTEEVILGLSPLSFDYGLYQLLFALANDCSLVLYQGQFNPMKVIANIEKHSITLIPIVPAMATAVSKVARIAKGKLATLRKLTNTGGHLSESTIREWKKHCPELQIFSMYGLTECKRALYLEPELWNAKMGSVGKPIPGLDARVFIESGEGNYVEADPYQVGELFVRGSGVMQSYRKSHSGGGARIISGDYRDDNWLATGDLFCYDEDGFFYFKGRTKELIKQAGFCIYPVEVESAVEQHANVSLCAIIGSTDRYGDETALMFIQLCDNSEEAQTAIKHWLKETIDNDYLPREVRFVEEMALTVNSKIDKNQLKKLVMEE